MAAKATRTIRMEEQLEPWECRLLASHERVRKKRYCHAYGPFSRNPLIGDIDPADREFYDCFVYKYNAHDELVSFPDENPSVLQMPGPAARGGVSVDGPRDVEDARKLLCKWFDKKRKPVLVTCPTHGTLSRTA